MGQVAATVRKQEGDRWGSAGFLLFIHAEIPAREVMLPVPASQFQRPSLPFSVKPVWTLPEAFRGGSNSSQADSKSHFKILNLGSLKRLFPKPPP